NEWWPSGTLPSSYDSYEFTGELRSSVSAASDLAYVFINGDTTLTNYRKAFSFAGSTTGGSASSDPLMCEPVAATGIADTYTTCSGEVIAPGNTTKTKTILNKSYRRYDANGNWVGLYGVNWES